MSARVKMWLPLTELAKCKSAEAQVKGWCGEETCDLKDKVKITEHENHFYFALNVNESIWLICPLVLTELFHTETSLDLVGTGSLVRTGATQSVMLGRCRNSTLSKSHLSQKDGTLSNDKHVAAFNSPSFRSNPQTPPLSLLSLVSGSTS